MTFENKLPSGYTTGTIDLDGDKKLSLRLYAAAAAIAVALTVVCCFLKDISLLFDASGVFALLGRFVLIMLITAACLVGQEHLKCIIIGKLTGKPARVVRGRMSAYIEYKCWLDKRSYLIMSLAPAAAVCLVLLILMIVSARQAVLAVLCDIYRQPHRRVRRRICCVQALQGKVGCAHKKRGIQDTYCNGEITKCR